MQLSAEAQAGLERFKVALAANAHLSDEELLRHLRRRHRTAAAAASPPDPLLPLRRAPKPRAPRRREGQPPPWRTRQYARAVSTMIGHDRRLVPNCTRLALEIVALAGRRGFVEITRARLGARLGLSGRSITRLLADLIRYGYVAAERTKTRTGSDAGLRLIVLNPLKPY